MEGEGGGRGGEEKVGGGGEGEGRGREGGVGGGRSVCDAGLFKIAVSGFPFFKDWFLFLSSLLFFSLDQLMKSCFCFATPA